MFILHLATIALLLPSALNFVEVSGWYSTYLMGNECTTGLARMSVSTVPYDGMFALEGEHLQRLAITAIGLKKGDTVLDLACGAGVNLPHLVNHVGPTGRILAVDYSEGMLHAARMKADANCWPNVEFQQIDATQLELPANSVDGVLCTFGLSAMPGERAALRRIATALKPSARFVALDAKAFTGFARIFNPVTGPLFKHATNWDYKKDVLGSIREVFGETVVQEYNSGCNFIAVAKKS